MNTSSLEDVQKHGAFDFVVVGTKWLLVLIDKMLNHFQTAGLALATRLTENPSVSVLVLEAGPANLDDPNILTPAKFASHFNDPQYDWAFNTVGQEHAGGRSIFFPRGKGLGGSSAINFFMYHRPANSDIDAFEELGNAGWNWDLLKKYYMKAEHFIAPLEKIDTMSYDLNERGSDGPLELGYPITLSNLEGPYHEALQKVGINRAEEPTTGTWLTPVSIHPIKRVRSYAANMYYQPNASRPNFTVLVSAQVTKIVLKMNSGVATAEKVSFVHNGETHEVAVAKEVILCAGAIMSPQILELSGIGDPQILSKAGIDIQVSLPGVGENIQEHLDKEDDYNTFDCLRDGAIAAQQFAEYQLHGKGVFGMAPTAMTFVPLASISPDSAALQKSLAESIEAGRASGKYSVALQKQFKVQLAHIAKKEPSCELILAQTFRSYPNQPEPNRKYLSMASLLNHPISRGSIHIKSGNPLDPPAIDPRYFESAYDLQTVVEMVKFNRRLVNPGPDIQTDEQIAAWIKNFFNSTWHTVGSCSMLPLEDGGVVDNKLKVYKTTNIRVVDLSIIPLHIGAHTQATAYALGELGADIIKGNVFT
ncbi:alcohol oxidase [Mycena rebaudengoi]|nr:alcohol oxidase [Mycena rebaudengoi]